MVHAASYSHCDAERLLLKMGGNVSGPVEVDETFIGGKTKNMRRERRLRIQTAQKQDQKTIVMGMLDRETRQVRARVVPNVKRETLQNAILEQIEKGSTVHTDQYTVYDHLAAQEFIHETVTHAEEYVTRPGTNPGHRKLLESPKADS